MSYSQTDHRTVHNVLHTDCPYCKMVEVAAKLKTMAQKQADRLNENPSYKGQAMADEQRAYHLANELLDHVYEEPF